MWKKFDYYLHYVFALCLKTVSKWSSSGASASVTSNLSIFVLIPPHPLPTSRNCYRTPASDLQKNPEERPQSICPEGPVGIRSPTCPRTWRTSALLWSYHGRPYASVRYRSGEQEPLVPIVDFLSSIKSGTSFNRVTDYWKKKQKMCTFLTGRFKLGVRKYGNCMIFTFVFIWSFRIFNRPSVYVLFHGKKIKNK